MEAVSEPSESPSLEELDDELEDELLDERLAEDEELLELELLLEGMDGIDAVEDEEELDGDREADDDLDELGIDGDDEEDDEDELLGIEGMLLLLLELCWVDSQPARIRANTEAPTKPRARPETRWKKGVFMVASVSFEGVREPLKFHPVRHNIRTRTGIL